MAVLVGADGARAKETGERDGKRGLKVDLVVEGEGVVLGRGAADLHNDNAARGAARAELGARDEGARGGGAGLADRLRERDARCLVGSERGVAVDGAGRDGEGEGAVCAVALGHVAAKGRGVGGDGHGDRGAVEGGDGVRGAVLLGGACERLDIKVPAGGAERARADDGGARERVGGACGGVARGGDERGSGLEIDAVAVGELLSHRGTAVDAQLDAEGRMVNVGDDDLEVGARGRSAGGDVEREGLECAHAERGSKPGAVGERADRVEDDGEIVGGLAAVAGDTEEPGGELVCREEERRAVGEGGVGASGGRADAGVAVELGRVRGLEREQKVLDGLNAVDLVEDDGHGVVGREGDRVEVVSVDVDVARDRGGDGSRDGSHVKERCGDGDVLAARGGEDANVPAALGNGAGLDKHDAFAARGLEGAGGLGVRVALCAAGKVALGEEDGTGGVDVGSVDLHAEESARVGDLGVCKHIVREHVGEGGVLLTLHVDEGSGGLEVRGQRNVEVGAGARGAVDGDANVPVAGGELAGLDGDAARGGCAGHGVAGPLAAFAGCWASLLGVVEEEIGRGDGVRGLDGDLEILVTGRVDGADVERVVVGGELAGADGGLVRDVCRGAEGEGLLGVDGLADRGGDVKDGRGDGGVREAERPDAELPDFLADLALGDLDGAGGGCLGLEVADGVGRKDLGVGELGPVAGVLLPVEVGVVGVDEDAGVRGGGLRVLRVEGGVKVEGVADGALGLEGDKGLERDVGGDGRGLGVDGDG
eukprot:comp9606_c0_seq1/m.11138 comp9606_c0_seq1/g.11138  ORF comp9606_c0_seq1/g.11138 comp9606_c0_seq1/m.11138 type:complete len:767 (-) comp9606_c0_seq1:2004-4304(-)